MSKSFNYAAQFERTKANKARRAARRSRPLSIAQQAAADLRKARREARRLERMEKNVVRRNQAGVAKIQAERAAALPKVAVSHATPDSRKIMTSTNTTGANRVGSDAGVRRERCEDCKHWSRNHRLSEFGRCALCVANPHMGPDSAHSSKGEWDYCPEFSPNSSHALAAALN